MKTDLHLDIIFKSYTYIVIELSNFLFTAEVSKLKTEAEITLAV